MKDLETLRAAALRVLDRLERLAEQTRPRLSNFERGARWRRYQSELQNLPGVQILPPDPESPDRHHRLVFAPAPPVAPPPLPAALEKWTTLENDPRREPRPAASRKREVTPVEAAGLVKARLARPKNLGKTKPDGLRTVELFFDDDSPAKRKWAAYREEWREWQKREAPRRAANAAHSQLSAFLPAVRGDDDAGEPLEVVVGIGLARLRPACNCAVAEIAAEMRAEQSGEIVIRPRGAPALALPHFAESPERIVVAETFAETQRKTAEINPFNPVFLQPVLKAAKDNLAPNAVQGDNHAPGEEMPAELTLYPNWHIAVRPREDASVMKKVAAEFRREVESAKTPQDIPDLLIRAAFGPESDPETAKESAPNSETKTEAEAANNPPAPALFSCNPEQAEVLTRMANPETRGMAILSPAASGATRTLANLACQTLARGGRMLAVSRERAHLTDLLETLPESLRRFAAAPLFGESENRRQIAATARALAQAASETDADGAEAALKADEAEREKLLGEIAELEAANARLAAPHFASVAPLFAEVLPRPVLAHLAKWAADNAEKFEWFSDRPAAAEFPPEMDAMQAARAALGPHLRPPANAKKVAQSDGREVEGGEGEGVEGDEGGEGDTVWVLEHPDRAPELEIPPDAEPEEPLPDSAVAVAEMMTVERGEAEKTGWVAGLLGEFLSDPEFAPSYRRRRAELRVLAARRRALGGIRHPDLTAAMSPAALSALAKKSSPLRFWIPTRDRKTRKTLEGFRLEGRRPRSFADWRKLLAFARWLGDFDAFAVRWNDEAAAELGDDSRAPEASGKGDKGGGGGRGKGGRGKGRGFMGGADAFPSWARKTDEALRHMETVLRCAEHLRGEVFRMAEGVERAGAPQWAATLRMAGNKAPFNKVALSNSDSISASDSGPGSGSGSGSRSDSDSGSGSGVDFDSALPGDWRDAWRWGCAKAELARLEAGGEVSGFQADADLRGKRAALEKVEGRIAEGRAVLAASQMARPEWANATEAEAERILPDLPLVVAPTWRANEWLPARFGIFDAVAADGGGGSPAAELAVLLRGKRAAVFGDDRRFAPSVFGDELTGGEGGLGGEFLRASDSLYDFARRVWPRGAGFLRETRGAAWPLAEIVSRLFYGGELLPVWFPSAQERTGSPLTAIWVKRGVLDGGRNEWEARALVGEMERIFSDARASGRGVGIAALSEEQADFAREAAVARFGEANLAARDFVCDDADGWGAGGGGKRRDIALVSLADSPGRGEGPVSAGARRRLNLALGVGRLQLRLAHSVSRDDLREKGDLRRELLGRFYARGAEKEREAAREFERDLCARLRGAGYCASLGVGAAGLRAGIAVEGETGGRLGAELDGGGEEGWAEAVRRRGRLERGGWVFWRAFAADYMLDPERVFADLREKLSALEIHPWHGAPPPVAETLVHNPVEEE